MSRYHELVSWIELTRFGLPQFTVSRRSLQLNGHELPAGAKVPMDSLKNLSRLRQLYEQRAIAVVPETVTRPEHMPLRRLERQAQVDRMERKAVAVGVADSVAALSLNLPEIKVPVEQKQENKNFKRRT